MKKTRDYALMSATTNNVFPQRFNSAEEAEKRRLETPDPSHWKIVSREISYGEWEESVRATTTKADYEHPINMKVKDLKAILASIETLVMDGYVIDTDEMDVIIPVLDEHDTKYMYGFRHVRTAGILYNENEPNVALCLSAPGDGMDIESQLDYNGFETECKQVLF